MFHEYVSEGMMWLQKMLPQVMNTKNFPWMVGSLFLLGIVTKWMVVANYRRLIRKAENMTHPKNVTLRQIKMKYDGIKEVNGTVANPMLLVQRHLNRCKVGIISLNRLNHIISWCTILEIAAAGLTGWQLYRTGTKEMVVIGYVGIGCFFGFALEIIARESGVRQRQTELAYIIVDYLENSPVTREERVAQTMGQMEPDAAAEHVAPEDENREKTVETENSLQLSEAEENAREEQILNQVIAEFLQ